MKVTLSEENGISVIAIEGSIDGKTAPVVRQEIAPALESAKKAILDLSKVDYLSSAGLRLLLLIYREFTAKSGKLVLAWRFRRYPDGHVAHRVPEFFHSRRFHARGSASRLLRKNMKSRMESSGLESRIDYYPTHEHQGIRFRRGRTLPFGATVVPNGVNFSVFSSAATFLHACLVPEA